MQTEQITWHQLPAAGLPDAEVSVLVEFAPVAFLALWFQPVSLRFSPLRAAALLLS